MKYCVECGAEYLDDTAVVCVDCSAALVNEQSWRDICDKRELESRETFVKIWTAENQFDADVLKDLLEREEIPVLLKSFVDTSFDGIFVPQKGWASVMVPVEYRARAESIIMTYMQKVGTE